MRLEASKKKKRKSREGIAAMTKWILTTCVTLFLIFPISAYGDSALDTVKKHVTRVIEMLRDPSLKHESTRDMKEKKIRAVTDEMFDFEELSRRTLGKNWERLDSAQRKEFIQLYRQILESAYMDKILSYSNEKVLFLRENTLEKGKAEVMTKIVTHTGEIPISYQVTEKKDNWRVYDVIIEGVSLVKNYRTQFREILANKSPEEMLQILRKKVGKV
jgi:phospholipid transport system substrate-binding protein